MTDDATLLHRFAEDRDEPAFAELVQRHVNFVYACALRRVGGDAQLAEDVTQHVFIILTRQAAALAHRDTLQGWLHTTVRNVSARLRRTEQRRHRREQEAHLMSELASDSARDADWQRLRPVLDDALDALDERDREAIFLRFFEDRSFAAVGAQLRLTENAVRMRVERALQKLQAALARKGVTSTAAGLAVALASHAGVAAPAGLAASATQLALAASAHASGAAAFAAFMSTTKASLALATVVLLAASGLWLWQYRSTVALQSDVAALRRATELAPRPADEGRAATRSLASSTTSRDAEAKQSVAKPSAAVAAPRSPNSGVRSVESWQYRGTDTASDALESYLWAVEQVDAEATAKTISFGQRRPDVEAYFDGLSETVRATYPTPEALWAAVLTGAPHGPRVTAFQILNESSDPTLGPNYALLHVRTVKEGGLTEEGDIRFESTPAGWRRSLDDRAATLIEPMSKVFHSTTALSGRK
jgi:RNA polymerase sigma factor (sigma-70 family)